MERGMGRGKTVSKTIIKHQFYTKNKSGSRGGGHTARDGKSPPFAYTIIQCPPHTHTPTLPFCTTAILPTSCDGERKSGSLNEGPSKTCQKPKARYKHTHKKSLPPLKRLCNDCVCVTFPVALGNRHHPTPAQHCFHTPVAFFSGGVTDIFISLPDCNCLNSQRAALTSRRWPTTSKGVLRPQGPQQIQAPILLLPLLLLHAFTRSLPYHL